MSLPTATDLAQMRGEADLLMPDVASITDPGGVQALPSGGTEVINPSTVTGVACRLNRSGTQASRNEFGEQVVAEADYILTLPHATVIRAGWTVMIVGRGYTVLSVANPPTWGTAVRAAIVGSEVIGG